MTFLFFLFLAGGQVAVAATGVLLSLGLSLIPGFRTVRRSLIRAVLYGCVAAYLGVLVAFAVVLGNGLGCRAMNAIGSNVGCGYVADSAPWTLLLGYLGGLLWGGRIGWRRGARRSRDVSGDARLGEIEPRRES